MKPVLIQSCRSVRRRYRGFSLLEMLIGMGILSVVILALYALFDQTQKALRANVNQVDVSEGGRSVMDLLVRDVMRARASGVGTNYIYEPGDTKWETPSFMIQPGTNLVVMRTLGGVFGNPDPDPDLDPFSDKFRRKSARHELFYLVEQQPERWVGAGLYVAGEDGSLLTDGLGTLWRYEDTNSVPVRGARAGEQVSVLNNRFLNNFRYRTNFSNRLIDGVVFFRVTPFGAQGQPLDNTYLAELPRSLPPNSIPADVLIGGPKGENPSFNVNGTFFRNRALPAALELELGILPPTLVDQYHSLEATPSVKNRFLTNNAANVLVFRQRIPLPAAPAPLP